MDLLDRAELQSLATPHPDQTRVSLFLPTHRSGQGIASDRLRWKNLVDGVERVLAQRLRRPDIETLLAPARALQDDGLTWQYMSDGLAMFLRPDGHRTLRVPATLPELATVGDRLVIGPLLRLLGGDEHFLLLALSQRQIRLLEGNRDTVEQVELPEVPTALRDVVEPQEPRSDTMARPASQASRGGAAVFYGHGAGDDHLKKDEVLRFLREVGTGLRDVLNAQTSPLVLVGLEQLVAVYREVNAYPQLLPDVVDHNPDQLSNEELHRLAWPLIEQRLRAQRAALRERYHALTGTARVSSDLRSVVEAAEQGRVETLFMASDPGCWDRVNGASPTIVRWGADAQFAPCEQVEAAAVATLNADGEVIASAQPVDPGSDVAAILRY